MSTTPSLVMAGNPGLARKLRGTGRFPAVFDVASAAELRDLARSGDVRPPAAFLFAPDFEEDLPGANVPYLADGLVASGFTVLVHGFFLERGDTFDPRVITTAAPLSMADLLTTLGADQPAGAGEPDLLPEPPPEPWILSDAASAEQAALGPASPPPPAGGASQPTGFPFPGPDGEWTYPAARQELPPGGQEEQAPAGAESGRAEPSEPSAEPAAEQASAGWWDSSWETPPEPEESRSFAAGTQQPPTEPDTSRPFGGGAQQPPPGPDVNQPFGGWQQPAPDAEASQPFGGWPQQPAPGPDASRPFGGWQQPHGPGAGESAPGWQGWDAPLGPDHGAQPHEAPSYGAPAPSTAPAPPAGREEERRGRRPRPAALALVLLVLVGAGLTAVNLLGGDGDPGGRAQANASRPDASPPSSEAPLPQASPPQTEAPPTPTSTASPTPVRPAREFTPAQVRIVDGRVSIEVLWQDRSGGKAAYYVVGGPTGQPPSTLANAPAGSTKVMVTALNPSVDYCLTVVAVVDVDQVAHSKPVCTHRVKRNG